MDGPGCTKDCRGSITVGGAPAKHLVGELAIVGDESERERTATVVAGGKQQSILGVLTRTDYKRFILKMRVEEMQPVVDMLAENPILDSNADLLQMALTLHPSRRGGGEMAAGRSDRRPTAGHPATREPGVPASEVCRAPEGGQCVQFSTVFAGQEKPSSQPRRPEVIGSGDDSARLATVCAFSTGRRARRGRRHCRYDGPRQTGKHVRVATSRGAAAPAPANVAQTKRHDVAKWRRAEQRARAS